MPQRAQVRIEGDTIQLKLEYNPKAIAVLKSIIPKELRSYDADTLVWTIDKGMKPEVERLLEQFYPLVNYQSIRVWRELKNDSSNMEG